MNSVTLTIQSPATPVPGNYRTDISVSSASNITAYLFVKQHSLNPDGSPNDVFVAVASPVQIEELPQGAPVLPEVYWRDNTVSLVAGDPDYLAQVVQDIQTDIQQTLSQADELSNLVTTQTVTITG